MSISCRVVAPCDAPAPPPPRQPAGTRDLAAQRSWRRSSGAPLSHCGHKRVTGEHAHFARRTEFITLRKFEYPPPPPLAPLSSTQDSCLGQPVCAGSCARAVILWAGHVFCRPHDVGHPFGHHEPAIREPRHRGARLVARRRGGRQARLPQHPRWHQQ